MRKTLLAIAATGILIVAACSKNKEDNQPTVAQEKVQLDLKKATDATNAILDIHKNAANGHSLCYPQEIIFHEYDSLYSIHFYEYNHNIYTTHVSGAENHHMNMHGENEGEMCGLDSIEYQSNMYTTHNYHHTDSLMYRNMMSHNLMQYIPGDLKTCYDNMQNLRTNHTVLHNFHY